MTPNFAVVHIEGPHWPNYRLWPPLFLLWIPAVLLSPFIFLILLVICIGARIDFVKAVATFWALLCSLPGTDVRVCTQGKKILVRIL
jgi:hypothetical protein